ncbi:MAG: aminopeptidase [Rhodospirillaceae bacterium]|nr:aminopeptidase [Rhodospirillaceae bacterium]
MTRWLTAVCGWAIGSFAAGTAWAQAGTLPQHTIRHQAIAERIVAQLQLQPGERVISVAMPGYMNEFIPHIRYAVMQAGGVDLGVIDVLRTPYAEGFDRKTLQQGLEAARDEYVKLLADVEVGIMLPGTNPAHPAYKAFQILLETAKGPRRTIHFHWTDPYGPLGNDLGLSGITVLPGQPPPAMQTVDDIYQRAILDTDYGALADQQQRFTAAMRKGPVRITTPDGTDLAFRIGERHVIRQDGDASAARMRAAPTILDREVEIPPGVIRVAPLEDTVDGVIAFPPSRWNGQTVWGLKLAFRQGKIVDIAAERGVEHARAELDRQPESVRVFREFGLGFNPHLAVPAKDPWIPYYGYGAGVVRLGIGTNTEVGGAVPGTYYRWRDLFTDSTITAGGEVWVKDGKIVR